MYSTHPSPKQQGFTLIELVIALTLGLLVVGSVLALYVPSLRSYKQTGAMSIIQENERYAFSALTTALQQAGYSGCNSSSTLININTLDYNNASEVDPSTAWMFSGNIVKGYSADSSDITTDFGASFESARLTHGGDKIGDIFYTIAGYSDTLLVDSHDPANETITFKGDMTGLINKGDILQLNDCVQAATFQIDHTNDPVFDGTNTTVNYDSANTSNCTARADDGGGTIVDTGIVFLGGNSTASCKNDSSREDLRVYTFNTNVVATRQVANTFVLAEPTPGQPTLFRMTAFNNAGVLGMFSEPLLTGIENMRVLFGVDTDSDNIPDQYMASATLEAGASNWSDVRTMQIFILTRSQLGKGESGKAQNFSFPDLAGTIVDCSASSPNSDACPGFIYSDFQSQSHARHVIEKVFTLRNSLL